MGRQGRILYTINTEVTNLRYDEVAIIELQFHYRYGVSDMRDGCFVLVSRY